jgi:hypothetical protein
VRTGRPPGTVDRCSACGEEGHRSVLGRCSPVEQAIGLVREGMSAARAAKILFISRAAVSRRLAKERAMSTPKIEEHW